MISSRTALLCLAVIFAASTEAGTKSVSKQRDVSKGNTLYVVPYAHLDTQWRWAYPQVIREFIWNTLTRNFTLMDKYPNYVFNFSGSRRYEMMKEYYPDLYEKLKGYVAAGKWFPCGSSVDEGDANVPSGESLVRHVLYGNRFFRREFGVASQEFMLPDCFGFPYALPSILAHCGIKGFSTQKLTWGSAVGIPFKVGNWEGPDGNSVVAALDPGSYGADVSEDLSQNTSWLARIQNTGKTSGAFVDYHYYGTGDVGGAPNESSVQWVEKGIKGIGPITVVSSHADQMVKDLTPKQVSKLPRYKGELLLTQHSAGSVSSEAYMKRWNRKNELLADGAEKASVAARCFADLAYPSQRLYNAWDLVLGSQMHDMLPGTSIPKAYEFCWNDELLALNQFASIETDAIGAITGKMDTRATGIPLAIYNPLSIERNDVVEATILHQAASQLVATGPDGQESQVQILSDNGPWTKIAFNAHVAPTGVAVYDIHPPAGATPNHTLIGASEQVLSNERFSVKLNDAGDIASIFDKQENREVLKAPIQLQMVYHNPSQFPAWNMDWEDQQQAPREVVSGPAKFTVTENGPVRVAVQVERQTNGSKFIQEIRLSAGSDRIEVVNHIDWQTRERALKAAIPLAAGNPEATYDLQLGAIKRANNNEKKYEVPQHQWFDVTNPDGTYGAAVLNDCKYGSDKPDDNTVRLTMIYTPGVRGGYEDQATQDFGRHEILFAIAPHKGSWQAAQTPWEAKRLNQPLRAFSVPQHNGDLGKSFSLVSTSSNQVEIQAIKKAEDSDEIVVRLRELTGQPARNVKVNFASQVTEAREMDGQERPLGNAKVTGGSLVADVPAFSLKTYAVKLNLDNVRHSMGESQALQLPFDTDVVSNNADPADGTFSDGQAISAEQFPRKLSVDGIGFDLGPTAKGANNAITCKGQVIQLPEGYSSVYVLAASDGWDHNATFQMGNTAIGRRINGWHGFVGQWDNRQWSVDPGPNFTNYGDTMNGLKPGYVKPGEVAWFASHTHTPQGNTFYEYSYLFKYELDIPVGATSIRLPDDPSIKVFAISVGKDGHDNVAPTAPMYENLVDHIGGGAPTISPVSGTFSDATRVQVTPPLYWHAGSIHYTLDGSDPTASSPTYNGPFLINDPATIKVAQINERGGRGEITSAHLDVHDTTAPTIVAASTANVLGLGKVVFSEPVSKATAEDVTHYSLSSGVKVTAAKLGPDGKSVELSLENPLPAGQPQKLTVSGVQDVAKTPNTTNATVDAVERGAVFTGPDGVTKEARSFNSVKGLPTGEDAPFTLNFFCRTNKMPDDLTLIAGFGRSSAGRSGQGRYFAKFTEGINLWADNRDTLSNISLDLGKWQMLTATYDGTTMRVYKNGVQIAEQVVHLSKDADQVRILPLDAWERKRRFEGEVRDFTVWDVDLPPAAVKRLWDAGQK